MEIANILIFLTCIIVLYFIGRFFTVPLKIIFRVIGNSIIGGCIIFIINLIGGAFGFHIGLNIITTIVVGILGIPRSSFNYFIKDFFVITN